MKLIYAIYARTWWLPLMLGCTGTRAGLDAGASAAISGTPPPVIPPGDSGITGLPNEIAFGVVSLLAYGIGSAIKGYIRSRKDAKA